jgi:hypothetical protein
MNKQNTRKSMRPKNIIMFDVGLKVQATNGHITNWPQIQQQIEADYKEFHAACKEYLEVAEPL